jgi:hypothetical protein
MDVHSHWFLLLHALAPYWATILLVLGIWFSVRNGRAFVSVLLFGFVATFTWIALSLGFYVPFRGWPELMGLHYLIGLYWPLFLFAALLVGAFTLPRLLSREGSIHVDLLGALMIGAALVIVVPILWEIAEFLFELPFGVWSPDLMARSVLRQLLDPSSTLAGVAGATCALLVVMLRGARVARSAS